MTDGGAGDKSHFPLAMKTGLCQRVWLVVKKTMSTFIRRSHQLPINCLSSGNAAKDWERNIDQDLRILIHTPGQKVALTSLKVVQQTLKDQRSLTVLDWCFLVSLTSFNAWGAKGALRGLFKPGFQSDLLSRYPQWLHWTGFCLAPRRPSFQVDVLLLISQMCFLYLVL